MRLRVCPFAFSGVDMAEVADWQRRNYKKVQSLADGGEVSGVSWKDAPKMIEEDRVKQEEARELSTIKDVKLDEKKEKKAVSAPAPIPAGNIKVEMQNVDYPEYRDDGRYARLLEAGTSRVTGFADGGKVKRKR